MVKTLISRDTAIGVLPQSVYVYSIPDGRLLLEAQTRKNKNGRIDFRQNRLAVPGHKLGSVHVSIKKVLQNNSGIIKQAIAFLRIFKMYFRFMI